MSLLPENEDNAEKLRKAEDRKRKRVAALCVGAGVFAVAFVLVLAAFLKPAPPPDTVEGIRVRLGSPTGADIGIASAATAPSQSLTSQAPSAEPSVPPDKKPETVASNPPVSKDAKPIASVAAKTTTPTRTPQNRVSQQPGKASANPKPAPSAVAASGAPGNNTQAVQRGVDNGNGMELGTAGGKAGLQIWPDVHLYLPLPSRIDAGVYNRLMAASGNDSFGKAKQSALQRAYRGEGGQYRRSDPVAMEDRPVVWLLLEQAGYADTLADWKGTVRSARVGLTVKAGAGEQSRMVSDIHVEQSSGNAGVDEAIIWVVSHASYFNGGKSDTKATFTYKFR